jgi:hypothetical protein
VSVRANRWLDGRAVHRGDATWRTLRRVRRFVNVLVFLMLVNEGTPMNIYARFMFTPFTWVHPVLFEPIAKFIRPFDALMLIVFGIAATRRSKHRLLPPMKHALLGALAVTVAWFAYGVARGGDARAASWQVYLLLSAMLASFTFAAVFHTAEHYITLLATVTAAGVYHAVMAVLFFVGYVRTGAVNIGTLGDYLTTHDDTVLWTVGICFLLLRALQTRRTTTRALAAFGVPLLLFAIQINHRRLAWFSLGGSLMAIYCLMPRDALKRRIRRAVAILAPILAIYAVVGWGRPEGLFRPLRAFESVQGAQDNSVKARNVENLGLIATADQGWLMGTGWGHKYVEVSGKYQIYFFELWPYVPHNSVLGLFAYTGYLGFLGYWIIVPTAAFFHARTARHATRAAERLVGAIGVAQLVTCADQWYGDMGAFSPITDYVFATCFGAALRVPVQAGLWPSAFCARQSGKPRTTEDAARAGV